MAERKPLFLDTDGFPTELDPNADSLTIFSLTVNGSTGITLVSGTVSGVPTPTAADHAANKSYVDTAVLTVSGTARTENTYTTDGVGVGAGDPVYFSGNGIISKAVASNDSANRTVGVAKTTVGASAPVVVVSDGRLNGVLTGATAGAHVYVATSGGLTTTKPTAAGSRLTLAGHAINTTDLHVEINYLGRLN